MRSDGVWIPQPSDWPSGWSAVCMYSRATAHMRTCAMRIRVAWRSPVPVYPHTLCVYPHSADEGIVSPRVSHPMDDISDVSRVEIPLTMILGSARPQITHLLLSASLHPRIPRTRMLYYAMGVYVHAAYCIRVLVLYSRTCGVYHIPHPILWMSHSRGPGILDPSGSHGSPIQYSTSHDPRILGSMDLCI
jgi:hypothetical protein